MELRNILFAGAAGALILTTGCASLSERPDATAALAPRSGSNVTGEVRFAETPRGLKIWANVAGLTPGEHGFHVHESGDCSAPDAMSAKGHFNPMNKAHGHHEAMEHHAGDMPNLVANANGEASYSIELVGVSLSGPNGVLGRSIVVHADPDDYRSQPAGNSGKRLACGVIAAR